MTAPATNFILTRLLERRAIVQKQLDDVLAAPQSYSIQGSYSQTAQSPDTLRAELARLDSAISAFVTGGDGTLKRVYPAYRNPQ